MQEQFPNQERRAVALQPITQGTSAYSRLDSTTTYIAKRDRHRVPDCYWTHLTPEAMRIYEIMYDACKNADGLVECKPALRSERDPAE